MAFKASIILTATDGANRSGSRSESWYSTKGSMDQVIAAGRDLALFRARLASTGTVVNGLRVSNLAFPGLVKSIPLSIRGAAGVADNMWQSALYRIDGNNNGQRSMILSCISDDHIINGVRTWSDVAVPFSMGANVATYINHLKDHWKFRYQVRHQFWTGANVSSSGVMSAIAPASSPPLVAGTKIRFNRTNYAQLEAGHRKVCPVKGIFTVYGYDDVSKNYTIGPWRAGATVVGGKFRVVEYDLASVVSAAFQRITHVKPGAVYQGFVGRASNRC